MKRKIKRGSSGIHRHGVFAVEEIARGERIVEYTGRLLTKAQSAKSQSPYLFELNKKYDVLGLNIARYLNHSCRPNCETEIAGGRIWICALRKIRKGEELTYNYHYDLEESKEYPCRCGAPRCVGVILAPYHWHKLRRHPDHQAGEVKLFKTGKKKT